MAEVVGREISISQPPRTHSLKTTPLKHRTMDEGGVKETHIAQPLSSALLSRVGRVPVGPAGKGTSLSQGPSGLLLQPTSSVSGAMAMTEVMGTTGLRGHHDNDAGEALLPKATRPDHAGLSLPLGPPKIPNNRSPFQWTTRP